MDIWNVYVHKIEYNFINNGKRWKIDILIIKFNN